MLHFPAFFPMLPHACAASRGVLTVLAALATLTLAHAAFAADNPPTSKPRSGVSSPIRSPADSQRGGVQLVKVRMAADVSRIQPGEKFHLAFIFDITSQWHIYWMNPGASGGPTEIDVRVPPGFVVGRTLFPRPEVIPTSEGPCYGYADQTVLFVEVTAPESALPQLSFSAEVSWMVCKDICKVGGTDVMLALPFGASSIDGGAAIDPAIKEYKARLPVALAETKGAASDFDGATLTLTIPAGSLAAYEFFPSPSPGVEFGAVTSQKNGESLRLSIPVTLNAGNALGKPMRLAGTVGLGDSHSGPSYWFDIPAEVAGGGQEK